MNMPTTGHSLIIDFITNDTLTIVFNTKEVCVNEYVIVYIGSC